MTFQYKPDSFESLYKSEFGNQLWEFLNSEVTVERMKVANKFQRPAIEAIDEHLVKNFGEQI
ncbi:MAG: hypothetical protein ACRCWR_04275, partial [Saezia sp.]